MKTYTPELPAEWRYNCVAIDLPDDLNELRHDEDLFIATWNGWHIWLDGGREISIWQCSLVEPDNSEGARYLMRDFLDTVEEVQAWINRAVRAAQLCGRARG